MVTFYINITAVKDEDIRKSVKRTDYKAMEFCRDSLMTTLLLIT